MRIYLLFILFLFCPLLVSASEINAKVLMLGVCRDVAEDIKDSMISMEACGKIFNDYRIIIYENNSGDGTPWILRQWSRHNPKVKVLSENLSSDELRRRCHSGRIGRTEIIAMARNWTLSEAMHPQYDDFDYIIMADMDFHDQWKLDEIIKTINDPPHEWDAVFANGLLSDGRFYDMFAFRNEDYPIGPDLLGDYWWTHHHWLTYKDHEPWVPVYSAFNGIGIYKRDALKGCKYSGTVTHDMDLLMRKWVKEGIARGNEWALKHVDIVNNLEIIVPAQSFSLNERARMPHQIGVTLSDHPERLVWLSCLYGMQTADVCEHVPLHCSMILKGKDRLYINPALTIKYNE